MERIEYRDAVDKSQWARGEWDSEPDKVQWSDQSTGLPCLIVRGPAGALCGYVGVAPAHPWHGRHYDDCKLYAVPEGEYDPEAYPDVHGGLTFAGGCSHGEPARSICHTPSPGEPDDIWWLGFDCSHSGDLTNMSYPRHHREEYPHPGDIYRGIEYVASQVEGLAKQAAAIHA